MPVLHRILTESSPNAPVVTLLDGERLVAIDVFPDGINDVTLVIALANVETTSTVIKIHKSKTWSRDWHTPMMGPFFGPGTLTFGNLGSGTYAVFAVR